MSAFNLRVTCRAFRVTTNVGSDWVEKGISTMVKGRNEKSAGSGSSGRARWFVVAVVLSLVAWQLPALSGIANAASPEPEPGVQAPLPLDSGPPDSTEATVQKGDFSNAPPTASEVGLKFPELKSDQGFDPAKSVRDDAKTSATSEVFTNPDGTQTARVSAGPVRFKGPDALWHGYDLRLQTADNVPLDSPLVAAPRKGVVDSAGDLVAHASDVGASLSDDPARGLGRVASAVGEFSVGVPDVAGSLGGPSLNPDVPATAAYVGDQKGLTVAMTLTTGGLEQSLIVDSASGPSGYVVPITLPIGIAARPGANGVEFVDGRGLVVATFGGGVASDSAKQSASAPVEVSVEGQLGSVAAVRVSVPEKWFGDKDRVFPVTIDPWLNTWLGAADTDVNNVNPTTNYSSATVIHAGRFGSSEVDRGLFKFTGLPAADPTIAVLEAKVKTTATGGGMSTAAKQMSVYSVTTNFDPAAVTWNSQPPADGAFPVTNVTVPAGTASSDLYMYVTPMVSQQMTINNPNWGVGVLFTATDENDTVSGKHFWSTEHANQWGDGTQPLLMITWKHRPYQVTNLVSPANDGVVTTLTPTLTAHLPGPPATPDGDPAQMQYWFKVTTGADGNSGTIVASSGWVNGQPGTDRPWTVPAAYLQNGGTYYWNVAAFDGEIWNIPTTTFKFKVDLRLGASGPSPFDQLGPVAVNLATGNVNYTTKSQSFPTVAGDLGLTYSYNSMAQSLNGLSGEFFNNVSATGSPAAVKRDSAMWFDWHGAAPVPGVLPSNWSARWSGYLTLPTPGSLNGVGNNWVPVVSSHAGVRVWVNNTLVYDSWTLPGLWTYGLYQNGTQFTQAPNTPVAIKIEYFDDGTSGALDVRIRPASRAFDPSQDIPLSGDWLSVESPAVSKGWDVSADLAGAVPYTRLLNLANVASLTASDGRIDRFTWNGSGYVPDPGLNATLTFTCGGGTCWWDYMGGGMTERFNPDGTLAWARSVLDDRQPAAAQYTWSTATSTSPARLTSITDPVSSRSIVLRYKGDASCPSAPSGYDSAPPAGMLCQVDFTAWGGFGGTNDIFYQSGRLGMIRGVGSTTLGYQTTTFAYTGGGRLSNVRDPLANDQYGSFAGSNDQPNTVIAYDSEVRASWVQTPEPKPISGSPNPDSRQKHTYTYTPTSNTATVQGLLPGTGSPVTKTVRTVTWDGDYRQLTSKDATNHTSSQAWDPSADAVESVADAVGLRTTTVRDAQHRPTDTYGPAPVAWFNGLTPGSGHGDGEANPMPHARTVYDGGLSGLDAGWWNTSDLSGNPVLHTFWNGNGTNAAQNWGSGSPGTGVNSDNFSGQLTGEIWLPNAGAWNFKVVADDGAQVFVDDKLVINNWEIFVPGGTTSTTPTTVAAPSWHRFRIAFQEKTGNASVDLQYQLGAGSWIAIPSIGLIPRYDLVTSTTNADGHTVDTAYQSFNGIGPQYGLPVFTYVDPSSLNLISATNYEPPGTGYLRPTDHSLPNGSTSTTTNLYYTGTRDFPTVAGCATGTGINQGGLLKRHTDADPDGAGAGAPTEQETIYNNQGRPAFTHQADGAWACTQYDARLRVTKTIATDGKVTDYNYNSPGTVAVTYTDSGGTSRSTSSTADLLGRTTSYTDEQGTITRSVYDIAGRVSATYRTLPGGTETQLTSSTYDDDNRILTTTEYVSTPSGRTSTTAYDTAGRQTTFDRPTTTYPVRTTMTYDANTGRTAGINTSRNGTTQWTDGYAYTLAGSTTVDWASNVLRQFTYDKAERLITTSDNGAVVRRYAFDGDTNRCYLGLANVGCTSPSYTYNFADQLTASPVGSSYVYDNRGRLDTYTKAGGGTVNIDYDANDHATRIDDGTTRVDETLAPDGRVLRRIVTNPPGGTVTEDTSFGYAGPDDSPAWARPTAGGTYVTYLGDAIVSGTTPTYQIANKHGDIVGTNDQNGTFTAAPATDEYGVATNVPASRLGWLGEHERFTSHIALGIIRMGVRLYQPALGRFLEADPIIGGSCNRYDYACGDGVNGFDLDGRVFVLDGGYGWHTHSVSVAMNNFALRFNSLTTYAAHQRYAARQYRNAGTIPASTRYRNRVFFKTAEAIKVTPPTLSDATEIVNKGATGAECLRVGADLARAMPPNPGYQGPAAFLGCIYGMVSWNVGGSPHHG